MAPVIRAPSRHILALQRMEAGSLPRRMPRTLLSYNKNVILYVCLAVQTVPGMERTKSD
jgi:hypothetical protein